MAKIVKSEYKYTIAWRDSIKFIDMSYDEFIKFIIQSGKQYIYSEKLDGELNSLIYEKGKDPYFITKKSVIHNRDYPVLEEYKNTLDGMNHIDDIVIMGELKAFDPNESIPFNRSQSIIRTGDVNLVYHYPFDVFRLNGQNTNSDLKSLKEMLQHNNHIESPRFVYGGVDEFKKLWEDIVIKGKGEGIVVMDPLEPNIRYRIKHVMTADVVVLGAGKIGEKAWIKDQVGYLILALLDENNNFILTSKLGTGLTKLEKLDLFKYVYENQVEERDGNIWIPPTLIAEVKYRRHRFQKLPLIQYTNNKYISLGECDGVMMDQASFVRFREDKRIDYRDLSIGQFPL